MLVPKARFELARLVGATPSRWCVYQFHHFGTITSCPRAVSGPVPALPRRLTRHVLRERPGSLTKGPSSSQPLFGPNYSLRNNAYCESCSSCGMIFFHWKMNLAYHDARYVDNYEETMYNALLGSTDLEGRNFYYTNPLDAAMGRSS